MTEKNFMLSGEEETLDLGRRLARSLDEYPFTIYLRGDLGAGKTTFVKGVLSGLGEEGPVRSPTYSLVQRYAPSGRRVNHFDLYRLGDPEELEFIGGREYFSTADLTLIEWPERGAGHLPPPDLDVKIEYVDAGRRRLCMEARSEAGREVLRRLSLDL